MSVSDADVELLEGHLDGELSIAQEAALRHRLLSDDELATELSAIRTDRSVRRQVFEGFEPGDLAVKTLLSGVRKQISREAVRGDRWRILRYVGSAAACVLFSFSAGWLGKGSISTQNAVVSPSASLVQADNNDAIQFPDNAGSAGVGTLVSNTRPPEGFTRQPGGYQVNLTDAFGRVVAVQHFDTLEQAREFSQDVSRWQRRQQQLRGAEPVDYKDQF
jgi:hypothetical protein